MVRHQRKVPTNRRKAVSVEKEVKAIETLINNGVEIYQEIQYAISVLSENNKLQESIVKAAKRYCRARTDQHFEDLEQAIQNAEVIT